MDMALLGKTPSFPFVQAKVALQVDKIISTELTERVGPRSEWDSPQTDLYSLQL